MAENGPLGCETNQPEVDEGTSCRSQSPLPGPLGAESQLSQITDDGGERSLKFGEIAMARALFKDAIDYALVRIHKGGFFPFGLQARSTAVTPNGQIYFNAEDFEEDFSAIAISKRVKRWFIHEMVHVWQYQMGYPVMPQGAIRIGLSYEYEFEFNANGTVISQLADFNMEAQGDFLADYFALTYLQSESLINNRGVYSKAQYDVVLKAFFNNPQDRVNLPS